MRYLTISAMALLLCCCSVSKDESSHYQEERTVSLNFATVCDPVQTLWSLLQDSGQTRLTLHEISNGSAAESELRVDSRDHLKAEVAARQSTTSRTGKAYVTCNFRGLHVSIGLTARNMRIRQSVTRSNLHETKAGFAETVNELREICGLFDTPHDEWSAGLGLVTLDRVEQVCRGLGVRQLQLAGTDDQTDSDARVTVQVDQLHTVEFMRQFAATGASYKVHLIFFDGEASVTVDFTHPEKLDEIVRLALA